MPDEHESLLLAEAWRAVARTGLRVAFGLIWVVNAALTWTPQFANNYVGYLHNAAQGQHVWSAWWFDAWIAIVTPHAGVFVWLTRIAETALALALVLGFGRKTLYALGALFSLLIWSTAEGFGGPYAVGATNMGAAIAYVLIFIALIAINSHSGSSPYSLDNLIEQRWPWWSRIAEWRVTPQRSAADRLPWGAQALALVGIAVLVFFLVASLRSSLNVKAPSPAAAAAAVSPLALASSQPMATARDARLPPLTPGPSINVHLTVTDDKVEIASGVYYQAWTYNGTVPGPVIHVRQGQTVNVTLTNHGTMQHSIDFHAAEVAPNEDFVDIDPGKSLHFSFMANVPGAFVYHCETMPILLHIGNGMYGALIVSPDTPLPPAAESYVIVQSEWYTQQISGTLMGPSYEKMLAKQPDEVVFNGAANQYVAHPLPVIAGQRVRIYFVDAGPNLWSSFHVIGAMFDKVYPSGDAANALTDMSAYTIGPGQGTIFDLVMNTPGKYSFVDHDIANLMIGAHGIFNVLPAGSALPTAPTAAVAPASTPAATTASASTAAAPPTPSGPYKFDPTEGAALYTANCSACHQGGGTGLPGAFPPLKGNPVVLNPNPDQQIETILHGLHGQNVMGTVYAATMPPFASVLNDFQIANIVNHERSSWDNHAKPVNADQVKTVRSKGGTG
ncbi:MAG: multicopper oxidase domain-containing protein [Gammaproteobacteria bacterium]